MNKKQKSLNNKGFSLVELIIVIAIMAVLVGVLAPQFIKYVGQSSRATDIQNAQSLATAYLADVADGTITTDVSTKTPVSDANRPTSFSETPKVKGSLKALTISIGGTNTDFSAVTSGDSFQYTLDAANGVVHIYVGDYEVYPGAHAEHYKDGK